MIDGDPITWPCPHCGAEPDTLCVQPSGRTMGHWVHGDRTRLAAPRARVAR